MNKTLRSIIAAAAIGITAYLPGCSQKEYVLRGGGLALDVAEKVEQIAYAEGKQRIDKATKARLSYVNVRTKSGTYTITVRNNREDPSAGCSSATDYLKINHHPRENFFSGLAGTKEEVFVDSGIDTRLDDGSRVVEILLVDVDQKYDRKAEDSKEWRKGYEAALKDVKPELVKRLKH